MKPNVKVTKGWFAKTERQLTIKNGRVVLKATGKPAIFPTEFEGKDVTVIHAEYADALKSYAFVGCNQCA